MHPDKAAANRTYNPPKRLGAGALPRLKAGLYALTAGTLGNWLKTTPQFWRVERYVVGSVYVRLGLTAALTGSTHVGAFNPRTCAVGKC